MYSLLLDGYCLVGKMEEALTVFDAMKSAGLEPDAFSYGTLFNGYCKIGRIDDGLSLFREMSLNRVKPTTTVYKIILDGLFRAGRTIAAKEKFCMMVDSGISE